MKPTMNLQNRHNGLSETHPSPSRMRQVALISSLIFLVTGGLTSAWAGNQGHIIQPNAVLHFTDFSLHVSPGGFHIGIGGNHRHGDHRSRGFGHRRHDSGKHFGHQPHFKSESPFFNRHDRRHHHQGHFRANKHFRSHDRGHRHHRSR